MATQTHPDHRRSPAPSSARGRTSGCATPACIPGVIYGHKEAVVPVTLPKKELVNHLNHGAHVFDLALDGKSEKVLVKEVQYDHLGIEVHPRRLRPRQSLDEKVEVTVPLELKGEPKGEADGGVLQQIIERAGDRVPRHRHPRRSSCTTSSEMKLDDVLHIKDLKLPAGRARRCRTRT